MTGTLKLQLANSLQF